MHDQSDRQPQDNRTRGGRYAAFALACLVGFIAIGLADSGNVPKASAGSHALRIASTFPTPTPTEGDPNGTPTPTAASTPTPTPTPTPCGTWLLVPGSLVNGTVNWIPDGNGVPQPSISQNFTFTMAWNDPCADTTQPNQQESVPYTLVTDHVASLPGPVYTRTVVYSASTGTLGWPTSQVTSSDNMPLQWSSTPPLVGGSIQPMGTTKVLTGASVACAVDGASDFDTYTVYGVAGSFTAPDTLQFQWSCVEGAGSFDDSTRRNPTWTAPAAAGVYHLACTVGDIQTPGSPRYDTPVVLPPVEVDVLTVGITPNPLLITQGGAGTLTAKVTPASDAGAYSYDTNEPNQTTVKITGVAADPGWGLVTISVQDVNNAMGSITVQAHFGDTTTPVVDTAGVSVVQLAGLTGGGATAIPNTLATANAAAVAGTPGTLVIAPGAAETFQASPAPGTAWPDTLPGWSGIAGGTASGDSYACTFNTAGQYAITAGCGNSATINVYVVSASLTPNPLNVMVGSSTPMTASINPASAANQTGLTFDCDDGAVTVIPGTPDPVGGTVPLTIVAGGSAADGNIEVKAGGVVVASVPVTVCSALLQVRRHGPNPPPYANSATVAAGGLPVQEEQADVQVTALDYTGAATANVLVTAPTILSGGAGAASNPVNAAITGGTTYTAGDGTDTYLFESSNLVNPATAVTTVIVTAYQQNATLNETWGGTGVALDHNDFCYGVNDPVITTLQFTDVGTTVPITSHSLNFFVTEEDGWTWNDAVGDYVPQTWRETITGLPGAIQVDGPGGFESSFSPTPVTNAGTTGQYASNLLVPFDPDNIVDVVDFDCEDLSVYPN